MAEALAAVGALLAVGGWWGLRATIRLGHQIDSQRHRPPFKE